MRKFRTLDEIEEQYLREHPDEIEDYITIVFEEYAKDGDAASLLSSLRIISRVKGVTATAEAAGMTRKGLQKALSEQGNPKFSSINAIMKALGYNLMPQKIEVSDVA
jgi:probable addiction module antidote protein